MKNIVFFLLLVLFGRVGYAQRLTFENIGVKSGLPASEVYNLHQDQKGYIWVFTEYGIVKYNGSGFVGACTNISLNSSAVYAVTESANGNMYFINSLAEVYRVYNDKAYFVDGLKDVSSQIMSVGDNIYDLFFSDNGDLWMTSHTRTYHVKHDKLFVKGLPRETRKPFVEPRFHIFKKNQKHSGKHLHYDIEVKASNGTIVNDWKKLSLQHDWTWYIKRNGKSYLSHANKILCKEKNGKIKEVNFGVQILRMKTSPNGHIWVCLNTGGLVELNSDLKKINNYLPNKVVSDVLFDSQSGIWATTIGKGLYHCDNINKESFVDNGDLSQEISFSGIVNKRLFIGTLEGKLFYKSGRHFFNVQLPNKLLGVVQVFYFQNRYYIATKTRMLILDDQFRVVNSKEESRLIYGLAALNNRKLLMLFPGDIVTFDLKSHEFETKYFNGKNRFLVERGNGEFFMSTPKGILRYKNNRADYPPFLNKLRDKHILNIKMDRKCLWICTKGFGVYCLTEKNQLINYSKLPSLIVYNIELTSKGLVLLSTNHGVFGTKRSAMDKAESWRIVLGEETLTTTEFEGKLYIGTKKGLAVVGKDQLFSSENYRFYLVSIKDGSGNAVLKQHKSLKYSQNTLRFNFDFLDFQSHNTILSYKLSGPIKVSGIVTGTQLNLQNLSPGNYTLRVYPKMSFGDGRRLMTTVNFRIIPAFWQTSVFLVITIILFTMLIVIVFWLFVKRKNKRASLKGEMERIITDYRLTALKAQINPHFMSNSLVAIQNLILQNDVDSANLYLAKFSLLLRTLLDYSNKSYASLKSELALIELYVELEQLRFSNKFRFEIETDQDIDLEETIIPTLVTQPFVENAIWHGLLPLKDHQTATLKLKVFCNGADMILSIIDNGAGRSFQKKLNKERQSRGTELIANRIESMNQLYQTTGGKIEIIDLFEAGQASGTRVNIILPKDMLDQLNENY